MAHFELGNITIAPDALEKMKELGIESQNILQKHLLQNFEPMPEYALLKSDQMYLADMEKNAQIITKKHGRIFSYCHFDNATIYIFTSLRIGITEGTLICLPHATP